MPKPPHRQKWLSWNVASLYLVVFVAGVGGWLVLRQPELRDALLGLVPHRYRIPTAVTRQLMAPRAIFLAAFAGAAVLAAGCLFANVRRQILEPLAPGKRLLALFGMLQAVLALATVFNLHAAVLRDFGKPLWRVSQEEALAQSLPQAYPDSLELKRRLPAEARIALQPGGELVYMLASLAYPLRVYDAYPADPARWREDETFARFARQKRIDYVLRYEPFAREHPLQLEKIR